MSKANDSLERWLVNNTGMFGIPLTYRERIEDCRQARGEQTKPRRKRFVYKFYCLQENGSESKWTYIGEYEVDNQKELWDLEKKMSIKYKNGLRYDKIKSLW